jgi:hypothetical protein
MRLTFGKPSVKIVLARLSFLSRLVGLIISVHSWKAGWVRSGSQATTAAISVLNQQNFKAHVQIECCEPQYHSWNPTLFEQPFCFFRSHELGGEGVPFVPS